MVQDIFNASWEILESLNRFGSQVANQILLHTKIGSKTTLYKALDFLKKENLIIVDKKKIYSINVETYQTQTQFLKIYDEYQTLSDNFDILFLKLIKKFKEHKPILNTNSESDKSLAREIITTPPYYDLISIIVRFFELGALMDFFINSEVLTKTIEKKAVSIRRNNEKIVSKFMNVIKNGEPVLWGETVMLIQTRLATKISPA
jgi:DNA-binding PadR family transcriptional regulator